MYRPRKAATCLQLLPVERVVFMAVRAYRIASFDFVSASSEENPGDFADNLEQRFGALLQLALRDARQLHRINDISSIELALDALPVDWMATLDVAIAAAMLDQVGLAHAAAVVDLAPECKATGVGAACGRGEAAPGGGAKRSEGVQPPGHVTVVTPALKCRVHPKLVISA